jgi:hypothetical protein
MICEHKVSQRQALKAISLPQSTVRYQKKQRKDEDVIKELHALVDKHPAIDFGSVTTGRAEKALCGTTSAFTGCIQH